MKRRRSSRRRFWTDADLWRLIAWHADTPDAEIAKRLGRTLSSIHGMAKNLGLEKSSEYLSSIPHKTGMVAAGARFRYPRGHVPANKGLRRPGFGPGRMKETQFKKRHSPANRDPDFYVIGALRVNTDGYIDMRVSFDLGAKGWRGLHRILWEDQHGPIPPGYLVAFKNGDKLDCWLDNLELRSRKQHMARNTIHNLPQPLRSVIHTLGQLNRRIREKQDRGSPQPPVLHA